MPENTCVAGTEVELSRAACPRRRRGRLDDLRHAKVLVWTCAMSISTGRLTAGWLCRRRRWLRFWVGERRRAPRCGLLPRALVALDALRQRSNCAIGRAEQRLGGVVLRNAMAALGGFSARAASAASRLQVFIRTRNRLSPACTRPDISAPSPPAWRSPRACARRCSGWPRRPAPCRAHGGVVAFGRRRAMRPAARDERAYSGRIRQASRQVGRRTLSMKPAQRLARLTNLPTRSRVDPRDEVGEVEVEVVDAAGRFRREVVAQMPPDRGLSRDRCAP